MTTTDQIPAAVREAFQRIPVVDEHPLLFIRPTNHLLGLDGGVRAEAVRNAGDATTSAVDLHPAYRFMMEAQLEALEDVFNQISERHPERFREVERGRVLIENLEILLNGTQPDGCGPAGA